MRLDETNTLPTFLAFAVFLPEAKHVMLNLPKGSWRKMFQSEARDHLTGV